MTYTNAPNHGASDVLRSIPRPEYPIQIFTGPPPAFSLEAQRSVMRWSHERGYFLPDPNWLHGPNIDGIKETVRPILERLGCKHDENVSIEFLTDGGFNRVYTIQTEAKNYVFRVALPVDPYYKTEADVATNELVRHFTNIPVPTIYAFDSSTHNPIGHEWILMDKIASGKSLEDCWTAMSYDAKRGLANTFGDWTAQLSRITSNKIGSIYMRFADHGLDFFVGRCVNNLLTQANRLSYDIPRGPFESLRDYYAAILAIAGFDVVETTLAYLSGTVQFEETSSGSIGTFLDQDIVFRLRNPYDKSDSELAEDRKDELDLLRSGLQGLQHALPELCAKTEISDEMVTMLAHLDLSRRNIFVDDAGIPVAVLDWENIQLAPLLFLTRVPDFMDSAEEPDEPEKDDVYKPVFTNPEEEAEFIKDNEEWYTRHLNDYQCTMLRQLFRETLRNLNSPLAGAVWEDMPEFDRELLERIHCFSAQAEHHQAWVNSQIGTNNDAEEPINNGNLREDIGNDYTNDFRHGEEKYGEGEVDKKGDASQSSGDRWLRLV